MEIMLSVLFPALPERRSLALRHLKDLADQVLHKPVEFLYDDTPSREMTTGAKVAKLMANAQGSYLCVVDDDDRVVGNYVDTILQTLQDHPYCDLVTFDLLRVDNGEHWSFRFHYEDRTRNPDRPNWLGMRANHLCVWRSELAKAVVPPDKNRGWDVDWYNEMYRMHAGSIEVHIPRIMYLYFYDPNVSVCQKRE